jgi:hypothetical protein
MDACVQHLAHGNCHDLIPKVGSKIQLASSTVFIFEISAQHLG